MSADAIAVMAPPPEQAQIEVASEPTDSLKPTGLHSPPDSNSAMKLDGSDDSDLSDLEDPDPTIDSQPIEFAASPETKKDDEEDDDDIGEVLPDHWSGTVPVFKPTMHQFKDFKKFMTKVDSFGMKSGIVKIIPPDEWSSKRPPLDNLVKQIRVREPIKQDIMGSNGTYRQVNILHQRSYNLPAWRQLCDQSEHQPPAKRGERRAHQEKPKGPSRTTRSSGATTVSRGRVARGRGRGRGRGRRGVAKDTAAEEERPITPISPKPTEDIIESVETDPGVELDEDDEPATPIVGRMGGARQAKPQTQSTSARRKYSRREASARIDEEAFKDWDYRMDISEYTPERCEELERIYWKTLTYAQPLYGADLPGTLFDEDTEIWNLNKLPNLLDVLGTKVPGVNTAYLYLGMWKATFAWHLEDVDLYSINYLHFGAPKQWYSISQGDARRFEAAMKSIWPTEAKACDQFLRHKAFLISPNHLQQYFNIKVNKCVSYPGEFVVTYPYGYHSGYNLGYNCAEAVNFALDSWLPMGRIAKKCECAQAQDSVWVDVYEIERKLRGEETDFEETEDEDEEEEDDEDDTGVPTPQHSQVVKIRQPTRKRKRANNDKGERKAKKIRLRVRIKTQVEPPCCLCPNIIPDTELLQTDDGRKAHRICALYGPETWIETIDGKEIVANVANISKARLDLKCLYCRSKRGACFQCSQKKCARSYHATCAAAAGVFVEGGEVPIFGEDGTEYKEQAFEFSCRFHRTKRDKKLDGNALDDCKRTREAAAALKKGDIAQLQYYRGDIFAGVVVENRHDEQTLLVEIIPNGPNGERVEVEWKWLLLPDPADYRLPKASANAIPMPTSRKAKDEINATKRATEELPRAEEAFVDGFKWAEFNKYEPTNKEQAKVDLSKENQIWYYLGKTSTEARAQYTEDPKKSTHNSKSNFLDTIPRPAPPGPAQVRKPSAPIYHAQAATIATTAARPQKPYQYKPKNPVPPSYIIPPPSYTSQQFVTNPHYQPFPTSVSTFAPQPTPKPAFAPQMHQGLQSAPRHAHIPKFSPPQTRHSRNKSLPFGTDPRFRTSSSTYGIMQPPGLGTSPSPQNGQLFQAQARARSSSAASAASLGTPMTSSAIRPSSASSQTMLGQPQGFKPTSPVTKAPLGIVQKYPFFLINHNRDSNKYRTPYAQWGGFRNGYDGSLRMHPNTSTDVMVGSQRQSSSSSSTPSMPSLPPFYSGGSSGTAGSPGPLPYSMPYSAPRPPASPYSNTPQTTSPYGAQNWQSLAPASNQLRNASGEWDPPSIAARLHPAIRETYAALMQRKAQSHVQAQPRASSPVHTQQAPAPFQPLSQGPQTQTQGYTNGQANGYHDARTSVYPKGQPFTNQMPGITDPAAHRVQNSPSLVVHQVQNSQMPAAQTRSSAPKQTFVPPPKPWEILQKPKQFSNPPPPPPIPAMALSTPANRASQASSGQVKPPSNSQSGQTVSLQQVPVVDSVTPVLPPPASGLTREFPEVPCEGSMELAEEIVRNARRASGTVSPFRN